jgi:capsular polysaccharide biosynthesis protein
VNDDDVRDLLCQRGFVAMRPEERSVRDQIAVFSRASVIIGMHGAGLTNVLFAPRAQMIELVGSYGGPEYFSMCRGLGNSYTRVQCEDRGENIHVNLSLLSSALTAA